MIIFLYFRSMPQVFYNEMVKYIDGGVEFYNGVVKYINGGVVY